MRWSFACALVSLVLGCDDSGGVRDPAGPAPDGPTEDPPLPPPALASSQQLCKLLSNRNTSDPTANDVQHAANVLGADLGIPVVHADTLYILFGDTIGFAGIWGAESHPDSVGYGRDPATAIAANPELLCSRLGIVTLAREQSIGPRIDTSIAADFAAAAMIAPPDHGLGEFIRNPAGQSGALFPQLPGDFEVPSGAFATADAIYAFYTTVVGPGDITMKGSYLARWTQPSTTGVPAYQILYSVDQRFDANGPLHGRFINIAAETFGDHVYLFGTGDYRRSSIHVARKRIAELATPGGFEELGEIIPTAGYGELSVRYFPELELWMLLAEELQPGSNHIVAYFARRPEGPWGEPITVHDMADAGFRAAYCCSGHDDCRGQQMFDCARTGFYGTYLMPFVEATDSTFTVTYTMSSFVPYNVGLFQATFSR